MLVAYQISTDVTWAGSTASVCGRTLEEAFGLENAEWCQSEKQKRVGLKLKKPPSDPAALALGLNKRVSGKNFDKTKFALEVMASGGGWVTPKYIKEGLVWLAEQVALEIVQETEALVGTVEVVDFAEVTAE